MSMQEPTDINLTSLFHADQEVESTAGLIGAFYKRLRSDGVPKSSAAEFTGWYATMVLAERYGVDKVTAWTGARED